MTSIDAFLCPLLRVHKTFEDAVAANNLHLLRRLVAEETTAIETVQDERQQQLRRFFVGLQVTKAARCAAAQRSPDFRRLLECLCLLDLHAVGTSEVVAEAAAAHDLALLEWLRVTCPPLDADLVDSSAAAARAAGNGDIDVLEWLVANRWSHSSKVSVAEAVANHQWPVLRWLENNNAVCVYIGDGVVCKAAELGDVEMLAWLLARPRDESVTFGGDGAASGGHVNVLEWLLAHDAREAQCFQKGYTDAARNGHLDVLEWLYAHYPKRLWTETVRAAAEAEQLAVVAFLLAKREPNDSMKGVAFSAVSNNRVDVVRLLVEHSAVPDPGFLDGAAMCGNLEMVQWLHEEHGAEVTEFVIYYAVMDSHVHVLEYLLPLCHDAIVGRSIWGAVQRNDLALVQWLHVKISEPDSPLRGTAQGLERWLSVSGILLTPIDEAASKRNLEMIRWLEANGYGEATTRAINMAAARGHLEIIQWLHAHRTEGCTTDAMDGAAAYGHLDVVKWLHQHRTEGCTTYAMDRAAWYGHLEVVQWLHEHRTEGCTTVAMDRAAWDGHLDVVRWLHENRTEGCTTDAVDHAVRSGRTRVVEFLLQNRSEGCTNNVVNCAIDMRHNIEMIHLLFTYQREMVDVERVRAQADGNEAMQRWLRLVTESD